jgi:hypothetical protein
VAGDSKFKTSLGNLARPCLKIKVKKQKCTEAEGSLGMGKAQGSIPNTVKPTTTTKKKQPNKNKTQTSVPGDPGLRLFTYGHCREGHLPLSRVPLLLYNRTARLGHLSETLNLHGGWHISVTFFHVTDVIIYVTSKEPLLDTD